jgi:hypothetical protein
MRLGFEDDTDGNTSPVGVEDFDMEEVYRRLDGETEAEAPEKDAVRVALRAIIDAIMPPKMRSGDANFLASVGRNAVILAFAVGHHSISTRRVVDIAKTVGVSPEYARKRLMTIRRRCRM